MEHFLGIDLHKDVSQMAVLRESKSASQLARSYALLLML
jgi:hypothetical protein